MAILAGKKMIHHTQLRLRGHNLKVQWTQRADRQLLLEKSPVTVTMLLYFSCLVKKKVSFDPALSATEPVTTADGHWKISFRLVKPAACSPEEFAKKLPIGFEFDSKAASQMHPKTLSLDYYNGQWQGEFCLSRYNG